MIKTYCQYSYGGFKTFYIEGLKDEHLNPYSEVTLDKPHDFPNDAHVFFQYGGSKIIYRQLQDGRLCLVVREIPSNDTDGAGRNINCAVQFIGNEEDRKTLDNLALVIANDVTGFSSFFADLFYDIKGLHIEGDKLHEYIGKWDNRVKIEGETHPVLSHIGSKQNGVYLFVPLSEKFGRDKVVTSNVYKELKLNKDDLSGAVIRFSELLRFQKLLTITPQLQSEEVDIQSKPDVKVLPPPVDNPEVVPPTKNPEVVPPATKATEEKQPKEPSSQPVPYPRNNDNKEIEELKQKLRQYKKIGFGMAALVLLLLIMSISRCSNSDDKKNIDRLMQTEQIDSCQTNN